MARRARDLGRIFGVRLDELRSEAELRETFEDFLGGDRAYRVFTPNPEILLRARTDPAFAEVLNSADLALPDGTGVALIGSLRARRRVRRWPGIEVGAALVRLAADREVPVAFFGGADGAAEGAAERWRARHPGVRIVTIGGGSPIGEDGWAVAEADDRSLSDELRAADPAIVLVGLGSPKQERWIAEHAARLPSARIVIGIGGAFDMWAGRLRRAPTGLRRLGLEWAWRLALEPRRLPRIVRATVVFPFRALTERAR
jgi:N-acetylglucosaminyldiphosphoundecaprenol N-acetyl-beta-D-mannosaminyltransferase